MGLGNQKCGTTWLHHYLQQAQSFEGGFAKEYHVWDALDTHVKKASRISLRRGLFGSHAARLRFKMQRSPRHYFDYFNGLYNDRVKITADITPSYCGLDMERLSFIRDNFYSMGVTVKPIILIREPVSRIKSAVRFNLDRKNFNEGISMGETDFLKALRQYYKSEHSILRTSYQVGISNAIKTFGSDNLYVGIYENMFETSEIERMSEFLGVPPMFEFSATKVNETKSKVESDSELEQRIREKYADTYDFCFDRYPQTQHLWS